MNNYHQEADDHDSTKRKLAASSPVVLVGRGGSGTRVLSELAHLNGIFLGNRLNEGFDSMEWTQTLYPLAIESLTSPIARDSERDEFWQHQLYQCAASMLTIGTRNPHDSWGWKLPETVFCLPQVLRAFPKARVVHFVRSPLTSALRRTHLTSRMDNPVGRVALPASYRGCGLDPRTLERDDHYIHNAVSWAYQVRTTIDTLRDEAWEGNVLFMRYEDLCRSPDTARDQLRAFAGLVADASAPTPNIDRNRTTTTDADHPTSARIWKICSEVASQVGYHPPEGT